jgi:hypothetical protein
MAIKNDETTDLKAESKGDAVKNPAPPAASEDEKEYTVKTDPLEHGGVLYPPGDKVKMAPRYAELHKDNLG